MKAICVPFFVALTAPALAAPSAPLAGCYERIYDETHLAEHPAQIVRRIRVSLEDGGRIDFRLWLRKRDAAFEGDGQCDPDGEGLSCRPGLSAADENMCRDRGDGFTKCRYDLRSGAGAFSVVKQEDGIRVRLRERVELLQVGTDTGPYVYLSPNNRENSVFLLKPAPAAVCR